MKNRTKTPGTRVAGLAVVAGALLIPASLSHAGSLSDTLAAFKEGGKASLDVRARYEYNEQGASINGYSLRTRLGYTTGEYEGFKAMVEMEDLSFADKNDRPALDVPVTELNQAWISYKSTKLGRQIYVLDDHRFIGHVGWRQNIQTFDAITSSYLPNASSKLNFGYLNKVRRVNATTQDLNGFIGNGSYKFSENFNLTGFAYLLDFDTAVLGSSDTFGLRGVGKFALDTTKFNYSFSYAKQGDNSGSPANVDFSLDYFAGEIGTAFGDVSVSGGFEILEGNGVTGFSTPLATVHAFNGFADVFAGPSLGGGLRHGLEDYYASVGFKAGPVPLKFTYHHYEAERVSETLGSEINAVATYKLNEYVTLLAKYAMYDTDSPVGIGYGTADREVLTFEANLKF